MLWIAPFAVEFGQVFIESSSVFITPKKKSRSSNKSSSFVEISPEERRWKQSHSPACVSDKSNSDVEVMAALKLRRIKPDSKGNAGEGLLT